jgi:AcrR family transcriptional regulator
VEATSDPIYLRLFEQKVSKGDRRKIQILEAALELIATDGFHRTNYETIGQKLGIRRSQVQYHFKDLKSLFQMVIRMISETSQAIVVEGIAAARTPEERLRAYIEGPFHWLERNPRHAHVRIVFYHLAAFDPEHRALHTESREAGLDRVRSLLADLPGMRKAMIPQLARAIQAMITGTLVDHFTTDRPESLARLRADTVETALMLIEGARLSG